MEFEKCGEVMVLPRRGIYAISCYFCRDIFMRHEEFARHVRDAHKNVLAFDRLNGARTSAIYSVEELLGGMSLEEAAKNELAFWHSRRRAVNASTCSGVRPRERSEFGKIAARAMELSRDSDEEDQTHSETATSKCSSRDVSPSGGVQDDTLDGAAFNRDLNSNGNLSDLLSVLEGDRIDGFCVDAIGASVENDERSASNNRRLDSCTSSALNSNSAVVSYRVEELLGSDLDVSAEGKDDAYPIAEENIDLNSSSDGLATMDSTYNLCDEKAGNAPQSILEDETPSRYRPYIKQNFTEESIAAANDTITNTSLTTIQMIMRELDPQSTKLSSSTPCPHDSIHSDLYKSEKSHNSSDSRDELVSGSYCKRQVLQRMRKIKRSILRTIDKENLPAKKHTPKRNFNLKNPLVKKRHYPDNSSKPEDFDPALPSDSRLEDNVEPKILPDTIQGTNKGTSDLIILQKVGLQVIYDPTIEDDLTLEQEECLHTKAHKFASILESFQLIWHSRESVLKTRGKLNEAFLEFTQSCNEAFGTDLRRCDLKRIVTLVSIWYMKNCDCKLVEKRSTPKANAFYLKLFSFMPKTVRRILHCEFCEQRFRCETAYETHRKQQHKGNMPMNCDYSASGLHRERMPQVHAVNCTGMSDLSSVKCSYQGQGHSHMHDDGSQFEWLREFGGGAPNY